MIKEVNWVQIILIKYIRISDESMPVESRFLRNSISPSTRLFSLASSLDVVFRHMGRSENGFADALAKQGMGRSPAF